MTALQPRKPSQQESQETHQHPHHQPPSLPSLTASHELYLSSIRSNLFLRHKQAPLRLALEEIAGLIVRTSAAGVSLSSETKRFSLEEQEEVFDRLSEGFVGLLRGLAGKASRERRDWQQELLSESEAAKLLLARLSWRGVEEWDT